MLGNLKTIILVLTLLASLMFNVATVTVQAVAMGVAGLVSMVAGASAVLPEFRTVTFRGEKKRLAEAVGDTSERIAKRSLASASRNAGSIVAEAIPMAGVAVILGVTAWDLKDSCETMRDLHELDLAIDRTAELDEQARYVCGLSVPSKEEVWASVKASPGKAWEGAKAQMPDLPEFHMPKIDWTFWN